MCKSCYNSENTFEYLFQNDAWIRHSNSPTAKRIRAKLKKWEKVQKDLNTGRVPSIGKRNN